MKLVDEMRAGWVKHNGELTKRLALTLSGMDAQRVIEFTSMLEVVFVLGGAEMLSAICRGNMLNDDIESARQAVSYTEDAMDLVEMKGIKFGLDVRRES